MYRLIKYIIVFLLLFYNFSLYGQSFSIYSVYRYGDELTKEQSKKIINAEWHKQEAKKINDEIMKLERKIKVEQQKSSGEKTKKLKFKIEKLTEKKYEHYKLSNELYYIVYKEKIDILWEKYESDNPVLDIIKAMENNGIKFLEKAETIRKSIQEKETIENRNKINEKACNYEEKGLDMISSALEGYYNYEYNLKNKNKEGSLTGNTDTLKSMSDTTNNILGEMKQVFIYIDPDEYNYEDYSESENESNLNDDSEILFITRDAPIVYMENEEILNLILNNYNIDTINEEVVITIGELKKLDKEKNESSQDFIATNSKEDTNIINDSLDFKHQMIAIKDSDKSYKNIDDKEDIPSLINIDSRENEDNNPNHNDIEKPFNYSQNNKIIIDKKYPSDKIIFKVQIAAARKPMTIQELNYKYKGSRQIEMYQEEGWYKYAIGGFTDYYEAKKTLKTSNVYDAFIAAYKNENKLILYKAILENRKKNISK